MKKSIFLSLILCLCLLATAVLAGCNNNTEKETSAATADDAASDEEIAKVKAKYPKQNYTEFIELLMDFHTPENTADKAFEPNHDYTDYKWLLSKNDKGGWEIVDNGY